MKRQLTDHYIIIIIEEKNKDTLKLNKTSNVKLNWHKVDDTEYARAIHSISASVDVESCNDKKFGVIVAGYRLFQSYGYPGGFKFPGMSYVRPKNKQKRNQEIRETELSWDSQMNQYAHNLNDLMFTK